MSLQVYSEQCFGMAQEFSESLQNEEVDALREWLRRSGAEAWREWRGVHAQHAEQFVAAGPAQRARRRLSPSDRLLLTLGAYQCCVEAGELLHQAAQLQPGGSYRAMAATAAQAYRRLHDKERRQLPMWPWGYPNPFVDDDWD